MKPWETLGQATAPDGATLVLRRRDTEYVIAVDGFTLMVSTVHRSESEMVALACAKPKPGARFLIGGMGMGFTLRAALDKLPPDGRVIVAELIPDVVEWNRGELGALTNRPLDDPRVDVYLGDVGGAIRSAEGTFDAILLDVDNGPEAFTHATNRWLYTPTGLAAIRIALRPGGALAVWSATEELRFPAKLQAARFIPSVHRVKERGSGAHSIYIGRR